MKVTHILTGLMVLKKVNLLLINFISHILTKMNILKLKTFIKDSLIIFILMLIIITIIIILVLIY